MAVQQIPVWKQAPFIRLFPPFCAGIIVRYYFLPPLLSGWIGLGISIFLLTAFILLSSSFKHRYSWITGCVISTALFFTGTLLMHYQDIKNRSNWIGPLLKDKLTIVLRIEEPLQEKLKSYKATGSILYYRRKLSLEPVHGKLLIYFNKDAASSALKAGCHILINKKLQQLKHHGNPGAFNYAAYASMQGIYHQVYLTSGEFKILKAETHGWIKPLIYKIRNYVLNVIRKYIPGKIESGLAEALLIGYKDDLDKDLLQAYANTGVVHVIAISGLHLGLIYWLLSGMFRLTGKSNHAGVIKPFTIIAGLWLFSLLAGASPSVLRSALMFTFIVGGESTGRKTSIFNSLAASAFLLLCYNPFWLWDAGFQLSYIAVLSLVIFMKPVYDSMYIRNKLLDHIWKLTAVTIAAQMLTFPLCIYLFHQFPVYFLVANLLAIPLSSLVLLGEILLCLISFLHPLALFWGNCLHTLISLMNGLIVHVEKLPFSSLTRIQLSFEELLLLYILIVTLCLTRLYKAKMGCYLFLVACLLFSSFHSFHVYTAKRQQRLIVYDIKGQGVEFINGRESFLFTSKVLQSDASTHNFCFEPSVIYNRISKRKFIFTDRNVGPVSLQVCKVMIVHKLPRFTKPFATDVLIISGVPGTDPEKLFTLINCKLVVFDKTNAYRHVNAWKQYCIKNHIRYWDVAEKGAFILNLNSLSFASHY